MIKNAILFRFATNSNGLDIASLETKLAEAPFAECGAAQEISYGWVPPRGEEHGALVESVGGQWIIKLMVETKKVPGEVVRRKVDEAVAKIESETGRKPGKKEKRELQEEAKLSLLPTAHAKRHSILAWINQPASLLVIDAGSLSKTDLILTSLVKAVEGLSITVVSTKQSPSSKMSEWLVTGVWPDSISDNRSCELKASDDSKATIKYNNHSLEIEEIKAHILAGKVARQLSLEWNAAVSFTLTDGLVLKKLNFIDVEAKEGTQDAFDADVAITTGQLNKLIPCLIDSLGGELEMAIAEATAV